MKICSRLALGLAVLAVAACQAGPRSPMSASLDARAPAAHRAEPERAGYVLSGPGFASALVFEARGGAPLVFFIHRVDGADPVEGELAFAEPWLGDGVHAFHGETETGLPVDLVLEPGPCSGLGYFARLDLGRLSYEGCARETGPHLRWSNEIADLLPAIESCQSDARASAVMHFAGSGSREVIHARREGAVRIVRYAFPGSGRFDCRVEAGRADWRPVPEDAPRLASEADPVFLPGRFPEAGEGCRLYARVRDGGGGLIGALGYDVCTPVGAAGEPGRLG